MNDNTPKREIHRLAIALDGVNKGLEAKFCNGEPILTIHPDGRVTTSDKLKPDEIASAVLQMMKEQWLMDPQATKIRELNDKIKRLEEEVQELKIRNEYLRQKNRKLNERIQSLIKLGLETSQYGLTKYREQWEQEEEL